MISAFTPAEQAVMSLLDHADHAMRTGEIISRLSFAPTTITKAIGSLHKRGKIAGNGGHPAVYSAKEKL